MVLKDPFTPKFEWIFRLSKCCDVTASTRHLSTLLDLVRFLRLILTPDASARNPSSGVNDPPRKPTQYKSMLSKLT